MESSDDGVADLRGADAAAPVRTSLGVFGGDVEGLVEAMAVGAGKGKREI
jgi:hypothetical protein